MDLRITSSAKNNQISFLIALDNFLTKRTAKESALIIKRFKLFLNKQKPNFNISLKQGQEHSLDIYAGSSLIAYYS